MIKLRSVILTVQVNRANKAAARQVDIQTASSKKDARLLPDSVAANVEVMDRADPHGTEREKKK